MNTDRRNAIEAYTESRGLGIYFCEDGEHVVISRNRSKPKDSLYQESMRIKVSDSGYVVSNSDHEEVRYAKLGEFVDIDSLWQRE